MAFAAPQSPVLDFVAYIELDFAVKENHVKRLPEFFGAPV